MPAERLMAALRDQGCYLSIRKTEHWNPFVVRKDGGKGVRQDLFGFIDILAMHENGTLDAFQVTGKHDLAEHRSKMLAMPEVAWWASDALSGGSRRLFLVSMRKVKVKRGGKAWVWRPRFEQITEDNFHGADEDDSKP